MSGRPRIIVIGSINVDLVTRAPHIPRPGETVLGDDLEIFPGGKGANQAYAAARLGAACRMIGCVGDDEFGRRAVEAMRSGGVNTSGVRPIAGVATGAAMIVLGADGQNAICVAGGANRAVSPADADAGLDGLGPGDVCLLQLEIPAETVERALATCRARGVLTVLDAAPAPTSAPDWLFAADVLTANESEAAKLLGRSGDLTPADGSGAAAALRRRGARQVVLKLGAAGTFVDGGRRAMLIAPFPVNVVDTTAAGDAFNAALAVRISEGVDLITAARWANAAGALACTALGAFPSMPDRSAVDRLAQTRHEPGPE